MRKGWTPALGLGVWIAACTPAFEMPGCQTEIAPEDVKKVPECVELFRRGVDPAAARVAARALIEERALTDEALESAQDCYAALPAETPNREALVSEGLEWVKTWDNTGRPQYLAEFFHFFPDDPLVKEARQMAAASFAARLDEVLKDEYAGLRAILFLLSKALGDSAFCVSIGGRDASGKPLTREQLLALFAPPKQVNAWLASGLDLVFEPLAGCPSVASIELGTIPAAPGSPARAKGNVNITRDGIIVFDKEYSAEPGSKLLFSDFLLPPS